MRVVLDTNILVAARRSRDGASNALLREIGSSRIVILASVPLFLEYEAVLCRPEHLLAARLTIRDLTGFLDYLAGLIEPVKLHYRWRPQLGDIADEMVLEAAVNGQADGIVTFNRKDFEPAGRFGIELFAPAEVMRKIR